MKLIWLSDLHFQAEGEVVGHDPRVRLEAAISHINTHHRDADMCVISGDMVNRGTAADYSALASTLEVLALPNYPLAGNHDDRAFLNQHLPVPDGRLSGFIQYAVETPDALVVCLDTHKPGSDAGEFCAQRLSWLEGVLRDADDLPILLFMHHHPMPLGLPMQDTENLLNGSDLLDLITASGRTVQMCIGHIHRPITGTVRGIPFATMRSVLYQAPAPQPDWDWESFAPAAEAPNMGVITVENGDVTIHYHQFCGYETGTA